ncbi:hypothetical protein DFJ73DRAFT_959568 [Zopfochytrium polystomum]|nr:hypothetical protein DFJ73DRAFT_959568 [Zopfochytrium polystomum]
MTNEWQPQTNYTAGSRVTYEGVTYTVIQPHMSQVGWQPPATPALWTRVSDGNAPSYGGMAGYTQPQTGYGAQQTGYGAPQTGYSAPQPGYDAPQTYAASGYDSQQQQAAPAEQKGPNTAMLVGGIIAGAAVLGAGAYAVHKFSENHSEDQKQQQWIQAVSAQQQQTRGGPVYWCLCEGKNIPNDAIQLGTDSDGEPLYAGRCYFQNGVQIGKAGRKFGLNIPFVCCTHRDSLVLLLITSCSFTKIGRQGGEPPKGVPGPLWKPERNQDDCHPGLRQPAISRLSCCRGRQRGRRHSSLCRSRRHARQRRLPWQDWTQDQWHFGSVRWKGANLRHVPYVGNVNLPCLVPLCVPCYFIFFLHSFF